MTEDEVTPELKALYDQVYEDGFFIKEWYKLTGVGDLRDLEYLAKAASLELEAALDILSMGQTIDLTVPGTGKTRVERLRSAWLQARNLRTTAYFPRLVAVREKLGLPIEDPKQLGTF